MSGEGWGLRVFSTAADVAKEPTSQDPLGFGASRERLAEIFAPGLTVNTRSIRYYQLLVAGTQLAAELGLSGRDVVLQLERLWALSSYLSAPALGDRAGSGIAGIQRVRASATPGKKQHRLDYALFSGSGQPRLGVWGLYRRSAERLLLVDDDRPTAWGAELAKAFIADLDLRHLRRASKPGAKTAATADLAHFGAARGMFAKPLDGGTAAIAWRALSADPRRKAAARILCRVAKGSAGSEDELLGALKRDSTFATPATAARALEEAFAVCSRVFDAAIYLALSSPVIDPHEIRTSPALKHSLDAWRKVADHRCLELELGSVDKAVLDLCVALADAGDPWDALRLLVDRHQQVQQAKGRQHWVEWHGTRLVRGASAPDLRYRPLDQTSNPAVHDFRLRNLRSLALDIRGAGVKLQ